MRWNVDKNVGGNWLIVCFDFNLQERVNWLARYDCFEAFCYQSHSKCYLRHHYVRPEAQTLR